MGDVMSWTPYRSPSEGDKDQEPIAWIVYRSWFAVS